MKYLGKYCDVKWAMVPEKYYACLTKNPLISKACVAVITLTGRSGCRIEAFPNSSKLMEYYEPFKVKTAIKKHKFTPFESDHIFELSEKEILKHVVMNSL